MRRGLSRSRVLLLAEDDADADEYVTRFPELVTAQRATPRSALLTFRGSTLAAVFATDAARRHRSYERALIALTPCLMTNGPRPEPVLT